MEKFKKKIESWTIDQNAREGFLPNLYTSFLDLAISIIEQLQNCIITATFQYCYLAVVVTKVFSLHLLWQSSLEQKLVIIPPTYKIWGYLPVCSE